MYLFRDFTLNIEKETCIALQTIYGVGWRKALLVTSRIGLMSQMSLKNLNSYLFFILTFLLKRLILSQVRIKRRTELDIVTKIETHSYAGLRHKLCLPVRGQRTRSNAGTQRSKRIKVISNIN